MPLYPAPFDEVRNPTPKRRGWGGAAMFWLTALCLLSLAVYCGNDVLRLMESSAASLSVGTHAKGSLENGKRLPSAGTNFLTYSRLGSCIGRTAVHNNVRDLMLAAYAALQETHPHIVWVFGETGWPGGGSFYPHRTHQNGLSVDFMVPLLDAQGRSFPFPASIFNGFGYGLDFDENGSGSSGRIDFEAMAAHLLMLHTLAPQYHIKIKRVIFAPDLQRRLFAGPMGSKVQKLIDFSETPAWIRHDDHYHVDFM